jgi:phenol 2-monooxygenase
LLLPQIQTERRAIAQELIDFDKEWAKKFSQKMTTDEEGSRGLTHEKFINTYVASAGFTSGCGSTLRIFFFPIILFY